MIDRTPDHRTWLEEMFAQAEAYQHPGGPWADLPMGTRIYEPLVGWDHGWLYEALERAAVRDHDLTVTNTNWHPQMLPSEYVEGSDGWYSNTIRTIFVKKTWPMHMAHNMMHEFAHHLDHDNESPLFFLFGINQARTEIVAELAAYLVGRQYGLDSSPMTVPYVSYWLNRDAKPHYMAQQLTELIDRVLSVTEGLIVNVTAGQTTEYQAVQAA